MKRLYCLWHPGTEKEISGYGTPLDGAKNLFGVYFLNGSEEERTDFLMALEREHWPIPVTHRDGRAHAILCEMEIQKDSFQYLKEFEPENQQKAISWLEEEQAEEFSDFPKLKMKWSEGDKVWRPTKYEQLFSKTG